MHHRHSLPMNRLHQNGSRAQNPKIMVCEFGSIAVGVWATFEQKKRKGATVFGLPRLF
jgi:hypothetical protein